MSFSAGMNEIPSNVVAVTESESTILLIPIAKVKLWINEFKEFNSMFYSQYNSRYGELISAMNHVLFDKMDKRLFDYLEEKVKLTNKNPIKISHNQIANDLGTAREVISRVMKKLQEQNKVIQHSNSIEFLG
jgi:CRP/FNR family transcriptional regulator